MADSPVVMIPFTDGARFDRGSVRIEQGAALLKVTVAFPWKGPADAQAAGPFPCALAIGAPASTYVATPHP
jgi:hypothetical protein